MYITADLVGFEKLHCVNGTIVCPQIENLQILSSMVSWYGCLDYFFWTLAKKWNFEYCQGRTVCLVWILVYFLNLLALLPSWASNFDKIKYE